MRGVDKKLKKIGHEKVRSAEKPFYPSMATRCATSLGQEGTCVESNIGPARLINI